MSAKHEVFCFLVVPHGAHRSLHDAAKTAAMQRTAPPAGRATRLGVVASLLQERADNLKRFSQISYKKPKISRNVFFADLVVLARGPGPDPIPNSTVKSLRANGTKSQDLGE